MCYCGTHLQGRKGNKVMKKFRADKELIKSRLMDFIFDDEYERIEDKETFCNEVAVEFRKYLNENYSLEDALGSAIFSKLFKYIENKGEPENYYDAVHKRICYEFTLLEDDAEWIVFVVQRRTRLEFTLCNADSNARYWVATRDILEIPNEKTLLDFIKANISEWIDMWETRCVGEVVAYDC